MLGGSAETHIVDEGKTPLFLVDFCPIDFDDVQSIEHAQSERPVTAAVPAYEVNKAYPA